MWTQRLTWEMTGKEACFITLTYNEDHLEEISKPVMRKFVKVLRKKTKLTGLKFFGCGEHGEESGRPHYHFIIIGWQPSLQDIYVACYEKGKPVYASKFLERCWKKGFNTVGSVTRKSLFYTTGYVIKDTTGLRIMSRNLGEDYISMHRYQLRKRWFEGENFGNLLLKKVNGDLCQEMLYEIEKTKDEIEFNNKIEELKIKYNMNDQEFKKNMISIYDNLISTQENYAYYRKVFAEAKEDQTRRRKI